MPNLIPRTAYTSQIQGVAKTFRVDADLLEAQILVESDGDPWALRHEPAFFTRYIHNKPNVQGFAYGPLAACSYGLLQIMLQVALEQGFQGPAQLLFVPQVNLYWGTRYYAELLEWAKGNQDQALAAYNGGRGGNQRKPYRNQTYVDKVRWIRSRLSPVPGDNPSTRRA